MLIGEILYDWRKRNDMSMRQAGERLGIDLWAYNRIEKGQNTTVDMKTFWAVVRALFSS